MQIHGSIKRKQRKSIWIFKIRQGKRKTAHLKRTSSCRQTTGTGRRLQRAGQRPSRKSHGAPAAACRSDRGCVAAGLRRVGSAVVSEVTLGGGRSVQGGARSRGGAEIERRREDRARRPHVGRQRRRGRTGRARGGRAARRHGCAMWKGIANRGVR